MRTKKQLTLSMKKHFSKIITLFLVFTLYNAKAHSIIKIIDANNDTLSVTFKVNGLQACRSNIESLLTSQTGVISAVSEFYST